MDFHIKYWVAGMEQVVCLSVLHFAVVTAFLDLFEEALEFCLRAYLSFLVIRFDLVDVLLGCRS